MARQGIGRHAALIVLVSGVLALSSARGESGMPADIACYAGGAGNQRFQCALQLSDATVLIGGGAGDMGWIPASTKRISLGGEKPQGAPTGMTPFILHLSADLKTVKTVATLPRGCAQSVRFIKTTTPPGAAKTGDLYISGARNAAAGQKADRAGYFIARLDANFLSAPPAKLLWCRSIGRKGLMKTQPWDVGGDGKVVYAVGQPHGYDWMCVYRMSADGKDQVVEGWRTHWYDDGGGKTGEWYGTPASKAPHKLTHSGILLKIWGRGDFRSWNKTDFLAKVSDGNGGVKQGKWPLDAMFDGYWDPTLRETIPVIRYDKTAKKAELITDLPALKSRDDLKRYRKAARLPGCGYYGYRWSATPCACVLAITIDRRTGAVYIAGNNKSRLPGGQPDFEPWVVALDAGGKLRWWQRLYSEAKGVSTPDQYADAVAVDYSKTPSAGSIVVAARAHGNNVNNLWNGNAVKHADNPGRGFQNGFTGTHGNMHFSWLGRLAGAGGTLLNCTYLAEYAEGAKHQARPFKDPLLNHWPHWRAGWPNLNTTRVEPGGVVVGADGKVYVTAWGRRVMTTKNAYMEMPSPLRDKGSVGHWADFARVYTPDLANLRYSTILAGKWDWKTGSGHSGVKIGQTIAVKGGLLLVGHSTLNKEGQAAGNDMPIRNPLPWCKPKRTGEMAVIAKLHFKP